MSKLAARRWLRVGGLVLAALAGTLILLGLTVVLLLYNEHTATWTAGRVLQHVRLYPGVSLSLDGLRVTRQGLELRGAALQEHDGGRVAGLRTSRAQLRWKDLVHGRVVVDSLQLDAPELDLEKLLEGLARRAPKEPAAPPAAKPDGAAHLQVAHLVLHGGRFASAFRVHGQPTSYAAADLNLVGGDLRIGPGFALRVDSMATHVTVEGLPHPIELRARGAMGDGRIALDRARLDTPISHVDLRGAVQIGAGLQALIANLQLELAAHPLDARDLAPFVTVPPGGGRVEADVHVALQGDTPATTNGPTRIVANAVWGAHRIPRLGLDIDWLDGRADLGLQSEIDGRTVALRGNCRPFDATVPYDFEIDMPAGHAALRGEIVPAAGPTWRITRGQVHRLDLARLAAAAPPTDLTLDLVAQGRGMRPDSLSLQTAIELVPSRIGRFTVDSLRVRADLQDGLLTLSSGGGVCGTSLALAGKARPFATEPVLEPVTVRFTHFDLGRWFPDVRPTTDLTGTLTVEGAGRRPAERRAHASLVLAPSRVGEQLLNGADLRLELQGTELAVRGDLDWADGGLGVDARGRPFDSPPHYDVRELRFAGLDLGAWLEKPGWKSHITGRIQVQGHGKTPETAVAAATVDLDASQLFGVALDAAHGQAAYDKGTAHLDLALEVPGGRGSLTGGGTLLGAHPSWQASAALHSEDLARLVQKKLPPGGFEAALEVAGEGRAPFTGHGTLRGRGHLGAARVDTIAASVQLTDKILRVDSLALRSNVVQVAGAGTLQLPSALPPAGDSLRLEARILDTAPLASLFGERPMRLGSGSCTATLRGEPNRAVFEARAQARDVQFAPVRAASVAIAARGDLDANRHPSTLTLQADFDTAQVADFQIPTGAATLEYDGQVAQLHADVAADASTRLRFSGHGPLAKAGDATLDTLDLQAASEQWALRHPVRIAYGPRFAVDDFQLVEGNRRIAFDGVLDPHGTHQFEARVDSLDLGALAAFVGRAGYSGNLDGTLKVEGSATAPHAAGAVTLSLSKSNAPIGVLESRFTQSTGMLEVDARVSNPDRDSLTVRGRIPWALPGLQAAAAAAAGGDDVPLDLRLRADGFKLDALSVLFPASKVRDVRGSLWLDGTVSGTRRAPRVQGQSRLQGGAIRLPALGVHYQHIEMTAKSDGERIHLEQLTLASGPGTLQLTGDVDLESRALKLDARLVRFLAVGNRRLHVEASGDLAAKGTLGAPEVTGSLTLTDTDIDVSGGAATGVQAVELTEADLKMLDENFGYRPRLEKGPRTSLLDAAKLGVVVEAGRDTWVRRRASPRLALEMSGSLDIRKQPRAPIEIFGRLEVLPQRSYAEQFGRRFDLETGVVTLNGDPNAAQIDFAAKWELPSIESTEPQVTVRLAAKGTMENLRLSFTSDPAMDETQILTCLTTGRPPASAVGQTASQTGASSAGTAIALGQAAGAMEDIGASVGLDVLQVKDDGVRGATVVAGSYVNTKTYLGVRQSATFENRNTSSTSTGASTEVEMEYTLKKWLVVNFQGGVSDARLMFRSRYSY